jgi:hypothetical protein
VGKLDDPFPPGKQEMKLFDRQTGSRGFATRKTIATVLSRRMSDLENFVAAALGRCGQQRRRPARFCGISRDFFHFYWNIEFLSRNSILLKLIFAAQQESIGSNPCACSKKIAPV